MLTIYTVLIKLTIYKCSSFPYSPAYGNQFLAPVEIPSANERPLSLAQIIAKAPLQYRVLIDWEALTFHDS